MPKSKSSKAPRYGSIVPSPLRNRVTYRPTGFRNVRDPVCQDAGVTPTSLVVATTSAGGAANGAFTLCPFGISGVLATSFPLVNATIELPHLPWLWRTAANFEEYRITRAKLIVTGLVGSTSTGIMSISSTTDYSDVTTNLSANMVGGKSFALADLAAKNQEMPLDIDSTWKKVTSVTTRMGAGSIASINTADDLLFSNVTYVVSNGPPSTPVASFYVEYDVEFRKPVSFSMNI